MKTLTRGASSDQGVQSNVGDKIFQSEAVVGYQDGSEGSQVVMDREIIHLEKERERSQLLAMESKKRDLKEREVHHCE